MRVRCHARTSQTLTKITDDSALASDAGSGKWIVTNQNDEAIERSSRGGLVSRDNHRRWHSREVLGVRRGVSDTLVDHQNAIG